MGGHLVLTHSFSLVAEVSPLPPTSAHIVTDMNTQNLCKLYDTLDIETRQWQQRLLLRDVAMTNENSLSALSFC